jgi:hypothetical protein
VSEDDSRPIMVEEPARNLLQCIGCRCDMSLVERPIAGASDPRSSLAEVGMGPVGLAVFPLVVQFATSVAVGSDHGYLRD